jgi:histidyl-tRNA synthetase
MAFGGKGFDGLLKQRMQVARKLWDAGIKAEFSWKVKPKLPAQFKAAEINGVPFAVILGDEELAAGKCRIKELGLPEGHPEKDGVMVELENVDVEVKNRLNNGGVDASITAGLGGMSLDQAASEAPKTT